MISEEGFRTRIWAIEWHANLWRSVGWPREWCEAALEHCSECVAADFYAVERPDPEGSDEMIAWLKGVEIYFDACVFNGRGPQSFA